MKTEIIEAYHRILKKELIAAMGCTEPIAIAYAAAKAREVLGCIPQKCEVHCSGNIIKNTQAVTVPKSGGLKGIAVAATLGIVGGDASRDLQVLESVEECHISTAKELLKKDFCTCKLKPGVSNLYILIKLTSGLDEAIVEIRDSHQNVTYIEKNGKCIFSSRKDDVNTLHGEADADKTLLNVKDILKYADCLSDQGVLNLLEYQIQCNQAIAEEGLQNFYGAQVGKILSIGIDGSKRENLRAVAKAYAAAGSDARMSGCPMPVVINSGSGNQGLTITLPIKVYADAYGYSKKRLLQSLAVGNLISIHQKRYIGSLSAYCGASSAACGAGAAIAYLLNETLSKEELAQCVADTITNTIATIGGMVCDGAKASCAAKIATAVDCAITAYEMSTKGQVFRSGEGLVAADVEGTIKNIGRMGREGMAATDVEILHTMLEG